MSLTEPMPSHRGHMPPVIENSRRSALAPAFSTVTAPTPRTEGTLNAKALDEPI